MSVQAVHGGLARTLLGGVAVERRKTSVALAERAARQSRFIMWVVYLAVTVAFINLGVMFVVEDRSPTILFALSSALHVFAALALLYHQRNFLQPILRAAESQDHDATMARVEREMHRRP